MDEAQSGIKIAGRNINNLRYGDDIYGIKQKGTKELPDESEKVGLKLNIQETKIIASVSITSWDIVGKTLETVSDFIFGGALQNYCRW